MLGKTSIREYIKKGLIVIEPFNEEQLNPNSYDVRLGNWFVGVCWHDGKLTYSEPEYYKDGEDVSISPNSTMLCVTKEIIGCVNGVVAEMKARSTIGRMGIGVCKCAGLGDVGYVNHWTGELSAFTSYAASLTIGNTFAQFGFHATDMLDAQDRYNGQYTKDDFPAYMIPSAFREKWFWRYQDKINKIKEKEGIN